MNKFTLLTSLLLALFVFTKSAEAKLLPQASSGQKRVSSAKNSGTGIGVSPAFRADRRALVVYFSNLQNANSVSYTLTYNTGEQEEGAIGTLNLSNPSNNSAELLFGTCSKNVCRYHTNISNMKLEISYTSKSGNKYVRRYRMKV